MKKILLILIALIGFLPLRAQMNLQGIPVEGLSPGDLEQIRKEQKAAPKKVGVSEEDFAKIHCWYGEGPTEVPSPLAGAAKPSPSVCAGKTAKP